MAEILSRCAGVVLAGGASSRMGAQKALLAFRGKALAAHALDRLAPQVERVYLNVREASPVWAALGAPLVVDARASQGAGPLAGIAAALARARADGLEFLATLPCDAPFAPRDLVARLRGAGVCGAGGCVVAVSSSGVEPMFALWPTSALAAVEAALRGESSPRRLLEALGAARVTFPDEAFVNLNTPLEFAEAEARADLL